MRQGLRQAHLVVQVGGRLVAALHDLAQAVAHPRVAGRAVDVEPLLAALEHFHGGREGQLVVLFAVAVGGLGHAGVEVGVFVQLAAGHGVDHLGPRAAMVGEQVRAALRDHLGLVLHVLAAAGEEQQRGEAGEGGDAGNEVPRRG